MPRTARSTAEGVALWRAAGNLERDKSVRNPDYLAVRLLSAKWRAVAKARPLVWALVRIYNRLIPGGYYFHIARTRHIDACLQQQLVQGIRQLAILGAGYDTRPYRFAEQLTGVKVFEADRSAVQEEKRRRVMSMLGREAAHVTYVPVDFRADDLNIRLLEHGYDPSLRTLFIWEGVCMYLPPSKAQGILQFVASQSVPGSSIVFDYLFADVIDGTTSDRNALKAARYVAKMGEPYSFGIERDQIGRFLESVGLKLLSDITPEELEEKYLRESDGHLLGKVYRYTRIAHASVGMR
jgi:methyltransferase (TIGR00027 family)